MKTPYIEPKGVTSRNALIPPPPLEPQREVPARLGQLSFSIEQLEGAMQSLTERLGPALLPDLPQPVNSEKEEVASTGVGATLQTATGRVRNLQSNVERLLNRLALCIALTFATLAALPLCAADEPQVFLAGEWNLDLYGTGNLANESRSKDDVVFGGGVGLNYWITRGFGLGLKGETDNLVGGFEHSVFDRALGRVLVRAPLWDRIAPYGYAEGGYAFERNRFIAGTGAGLDFRLAKGWALFGEAGLQVTAKGAGSMKGEAGVRLCW